MRPISSTNDYQDIVEEHKYLQRLVDDEATAPPLMRFYQLRIAEIEETIEAFNEILATSDQENSL